MSKDLNVNQFAVLREGLAEMAVTSYGGQEKEIGVLRQQLRETRAALKLATDAYNESLNANRPLPIDRELLGRKVREVWMRFAQKHPNPKPHWLTPWEYLDEDMREVDRLIGEDIARWALVADAASRSMGLDDNPLADLEKLK